MNWLTPSLQEDFERLATKVASKWTTTDVDLSREQRNYILEAAALLPGLRLCERRRLVLLAQSAPSLEIGRIVESLTRLSREFEQVWLTLSESHEQLIQRARAHLGELYIFAQHLEEVGRRREDADKMLADFGEGAAFIREDEPVSEPIMQYVGYETDAILSALREIAYPRVLELRTPRV